ncbi:hypothetical protein ACFOZ1_08660 [Gracilibacillus marinus]|uniref:Uncharacterized protein n=1 Tax=Gracilibacillus marinus TaxID=630535 RepID=A0ABV8VXU9_9BACI
MYGLVLFIYHSSFPEIPRPYHIITYNIDFHYKWVYLLLTPFTLLIALASHIHAIPIKLQIRVNSYRKLLGFYFTQTSMMALWGTCLIGVISFLCFPIASKQVTIDDFLHICCLLFFCYINLINIGLLLILLAKRFSVQIGFLLVMLMSLADQYVFGHIIFTSTRLLYRPIWSWQGFMFPLIENLLIMAVFLLLLSMQLHKKGA